MIDTKQRAKYILEEYANYYSQVDLEQLAKYLDEAKAEAYKEFAETGALAALQFGIDAIRQFIKTKTDLDPVLAFNPSEDELNKMGRYAFEMFENIAKELVGEDNV